MVHKKLHAVQEAAQLMYTLTNRKEESKEGLANQGVENMPPVFLHSSMTKYSYGRLGFRHQNTRLNQNKDLKGDRPRISCLIFGNNEGVLVKTG